MRQVIPYKHPGFPASTNFQDEPIEDEDFGFYTETRHYMDLQSPKGLVIKDMWIEALNDFLEFSSDPEDTSRAKKLLRMVKAGGHAYFSSEDMALLKYLTDTYFPVYQAKHSSGKTISSKDYWKREFDKLEAEG